MKRGWIILFIGLGILAIIAISFFYFTAAKIRSDKYNTIAVTKGKISKEIRDEGVFNPVVKIEVGSKIAGNVTEIFLKQGDFVKTGDILATVESVSAKKKLEKAEARIETLYVQAAKLKIVIEGTKITIAANRRRLEQNKKLAQEGIVSREDLCKAEDDYKFSLNTLEEQESEIKSITAQINEARIDLEIAKIDFENSFIRSPIDGIVLDKYVEVGQTISAGFSVSKMFDICSSLDTMNFFAKVSGGDIGAVRIGQKITIKVNTINIVKEFFSIIKEKRSNSIIEKEGSMPVYYVIAPINNKDFELNPGMTGEFYIILNEKDNILIISKFSLMEARKFSAKEKKGGGTIAFLINNEIVYRKIETGISDNNFIEILGPEIKEGDLIVTGLKQEYNKKTTKAFWQKR